MKICSKSSIVTVPALVAAGLVTALFAVLFSCTKEPGVGDGIRFRASAYGPSGSPSTKTVYGSIDNTSQTYQMLNWVEGDKVRIYSPQAGLQEDAENHFDDCVVDGVTADGNTSVATVSSTHGNGLVWGEGNPHYFYAVYPSPAVNSNITIEEGTGNAVTVTGTIPATQTLTWPSGDYSGASTVVGTPDMNYAYMYASTTSAPNSRVDLQFNPQFTAFQFEVGIGKSDGESYDYESITLTEFTLSTSTTSKTLSGSFTISGVQGSEAVACFAGETAITVPISRTLNAGSTLVVTVFALPQDLHDLTISFTGNEIGIRKLALKKDGEFLNFAGHLKYRIYGLTFPKISGVIGIGEDITWGGVIDIICGGEVITWNTASSVNVEAAPITWGDVEVAIIGANIDWDALFDSGITSSGPSVSFVSSTTSGGESIKWE